VKFPRLGGLFQTRRLIRALESLAASQRQQTILLQRLADRFTPDVAEILDETVVKGVTAITYSRDAEQVAIQAFTQTVYASTGHMPTEQEVIDFLDEKLGTGGLRVQ
jgi:hypothetical protein